MTENKTENKAKNIFVKQWLYLFIFWLAVLLFSCSPLKYVPEDKYLLNDVQIDINNRAIKKDEAKKVVRQKENYRFLGITKLYLGLYNLSSKKNENSWLKRIGEPPVIFDEGLVYGSEERLKQFLKNKGYFHSNIHSEIKINEKKRKVDLIYKISTGNQFTIQEINYHISDSALRRIFADNRKKLLIKAGEPFVLENLDKQREKISTTFRNQGYFYFTPGNVRYLADTVNLQEKVKLDLFVDKVLADDKIANRAFETYRLNNFQITANPISTIFDKNEVKSKPINDTITWDKVTLLQNTDDSYNTKMFKRALKMNSNELYSDRDVKRTFDAFNRLGIFRYIDVQFKDVSRQDSLLDCYIQLSPQNRQSVSFDVEGSNTSGNFGMAGSVNYKHKNLFKGAELFNFKLSGGVERQMRTVQGSKEYFNTREFGLESSVTLPQLVGPGLYIESFEDYLPKTIFALGYNYQQRPEYTRRIVNAKFGYDWKSSTYLRHYANIIDFNMVGLKEFDELFLNQIRNLYIKSSFTDHLIFATNYSLIYNTQRLGVRGNYKYLRLNVELAGNLLNLVSIISGQEKYKSADTLLAIDDSYYRFFKTRYAQYAKSDVELRYGHIIDKNKSLVYRAFLGVGIPYGNSNVLPYEKKYFTGGANGIRAWRIRSLGPGLYKASANDFPNQSSDIKLEFNIEYRYNIIQFLEGAFFLDMGNIWAIKDNRPGAAFKFNQFYKQLAIGLGTGLRFDFKFFLFRVDIGAKVREPSASLADGWIINERSYKPKDFNFTFAIGYPF